MIQDKAWNNGALRASFSSSEKAPNGAGVTPNSVLVREQLTRLLAHPLFNNSKRYPVLLAHTVEQALSGNASILKERTIGVDAFGREHDYDVGLDPIVRMTAAEVRKRLSQYYYDSDHAGELVIELPVGSYVPCFRDAAVLAPPQEPEAISPDSESQPVPKPHFEGAGFAHRIRHWILIAAGSFAAALIGYAVGDAKHATRTSDLERFWEPVTADSRIVTYCLGEPGLSADRERIAQSGARLHGGLDVSDVITLARSIVPLVRRKSAFRVLSVSDTGFAQLREGPFVLIGAFDNPWTMRITQDLPFGFEIDAEGRKVVDRRSPQKRSWRLQRHAFERKPVDDYAVVGRIHDKVTGQPVIILGGILGEGTQAASEVVSNPAYLDAMLRKVPKNWDRLNLEAIIRTQVIENHPGPPEVIAVHTW